MSKTHLDDRMRIQKQVHELLLANPELLKKYETDGTFKVFLSDVMKIVHNGGAWSWWAKGAEPEVLS